MLRSTIFGFAVVGLFLSLSVVSYADTPVTCAQPLSQPNYWAVSTRWAPQSRLFGDKTASWISMTAAATAGTAGACEALAPEMKQVVSKVFTSTKAGYVVVQALGDDRLIVRVKDSFDYPLYTITAEPGDFSGTMISQVVRLSTGDYKLELESSDVNGGFTAVIASVMDGTGAVLLNTSAEWTGHVEGPDSK